MCEQFIEIDCIVHDYSTKLGYYHIWFQLDQGQHAFHQLPSEEMSEPYFSGYIFKLYHKNEFLFQQEYFLKTPVYDFAFESRHQDLSFLNWINLVYKKEYEIEINENDVVYDLGANHGTFTMYSLLFGAKKIYAFEPTPDVCINFRKTFVNNENVKLFEKAISDTEKDAIFFLHPNSVTNSMNKYWMDKHHNTIDSINVECVNLESFVKQKNMLPPTILKCDIEGEEYNFINSLSEDFYRTIRFIVIEFHDNTDGRVFQIISNLLNKKFNVRMCNCDTSSKVGTIIGIK